jgi:hypothetical protein
MPQWSQDSVCLKKKGKVSYIVLVVLKCAICVVHKHAGVSDGGTTVMMMVVLAPPSFLFWAILRLVMLLNGLNLKKKNVTCMLLEVR